MRIEKLRYADYTGREGGEGNRTTNEGYYEGGRCRVDYAWLPFHNNIGKESRVRFSNSSTAAAASASTKTRALAVKNPYSCGEMAQTEVLEDRKRNGVGWKSQTGDASASESVSQESRATSCFPAPFGLFQTSSS